MDIFIDADTGAYGVADDLYILHTNQNAAIGDVLDTLTDEQIVILAKAFGKRVMDNIYLK